MFGFAHNGHGALADEHDRHRVGAHARGTRRSGRRQGGPRRRNASHEAEQIYQRPWMPGT